jgi:hypothetical protein
MCVICVIYKPAMVVSLYNLTFVVVVPPVILVNEFDKVAWSLLFGYDFLPCIVGLFHAVFSGYFEHIEH